MKKASPRKKASPKKGNQQKQPRRQLERRDTDEQVERALGKRLNHIPVSRWQGAVDEEGVDFWTFIGRSLKKAHSTGKKLGTKFWAATYERFGLNESAAADLADPPEDEVVDPNLLAVLSVANNGNPAGNPGAPFERYMSHCGTMNRRSFYGMCGATCESPTMSRAVAQRCQVAILKYLAGEEDKEHIDDYWKVMKDTRAHALMTTWEELAEGGLRPGLFVATYGVCLGLYHSVPDIKRIVDAGDADSAIEKVAPEILAISSESCIGESLFAEKALKARRFMFIRSIKDGLIQLLDHEFLETEMKAFTAQALVGSAALVRSGVAKYEVVSSTMELHNEEVEVHVEDPDDEWEWRQLNLAKSMIFNTGQAPKTPWEALLFEENWCAKLPRYVQVPQCLLDKIRPAREAAVDYLGPGPHTLPQMINTMLQHKKDSVKLDRSWETDIVFLEKHSERLLKAKLETMTLKTLPDDTVEITPTNAPFSSFVGAFSHT